MMEIIANEEKQLPTLLIVDDIAEMRKLLRLTFSDGNYQIFEATNGKEALKIILKEKPDIILLDIMMPGDIDGLAVCDFVKSSTLKNCRVILLTAKGQKEDFQKGLEAGADIYMTKPFSPIALLERVENMKKQ
ncbi:response regulator transcription factor [Methylobacter sp. YRD-M1]|uniref:response regulator transcription factor n=1 Tax=Methylobacter sp. YRD-M1 TaxID=2911520 RepID=UPI00227A1749|nr:response regulator [Methylobacter sp. YRD-M1]WAK03235.1 response regulator [Methylobacter sp. YRD-M1]